MVNLKQLPDLENQISNTLLCNYIKGSPFSTLIYYQSEEWLCITKKSHMLLPNKAEEPFQIYT